MGNTLAPANYQMTFNGTRLDTIDGVAVYNYNFDNMPDRNLVTNKISRRSLSALTGADYVRKNLQVDMLICNGGRQNSQQAWGQVKGILQQIERDLVAQQYGIDIAYTCTLNSIREEWEGQILDATLTFEASDPFGKEVAVTTLVNETAQTATGSYAIEVEGTALEQFPIIQVTLNSFTTDNTLDTITLSGQVGFDLQIERVWADDDVILVNTFDKSVLVNGAAVEYNGRIPVYSIGTQSLAYTDTFTARNFDIVATYNKRFV